MPEPPNAVPEPGPDPPSAPEPPVVDEDEDPEGACGPAGWPVLIEPADGLDGEDAVAEADPPPAWMFGEVNDPSAPGVDAWEEDLDLPPQEIPEPLGDLDADPMDPPG
jgi:hypothetical protein